MRVISTLHFRLNIFIPDQEIEDWMLLMSELKMYAINATTTAGTGVWWRSENIQWNSVITTPLEAFNRLGRRKFDFLVGPPYKLI